MSLEGEVPLYEEIFDAWKREKDSEVIQSLPTSFFSGASKYLSDLKASVSKESGELSAESIAKREVEYVEFMLFGLLRMRARKIALLSLRDSASLPPQLDESEVALMKNLRLDLEKYLQHRTRLPERTEKGPDTAHESEDQTPAREGSTPGLLLLRMLQPVPKLVGADLDEYGPFQQEDIVLLPKENALVLIARGVASEVKVKNK